MSLKILIIQGGSNESLPSGEQTVIEDEYNYLSKKYVVKLEYLHAKNFLGKIAGITWSYINYKKVKSLINEFKPNIIHFHSVIPYLSLSVLFAAKSKNIKVFQTLHNFRMICIEGGLIRNNKYCDKCTGNIGIQGVIHGCKKGFFVSTLLFLNNVLFKYFQKV